MQNASHANPTMHLVVKVQNTAKCPNYRKCPKGTKNDQNCTNCIKTVKYDQSDR